MLVAVEELAMRAAKSAVGLLEVAELQLLDAKRRLSEGAGDGLGGAILLVLREEAPEIAGLGVVVVVLAMIVAGDDGSPSSDGPCTDAR